MFTGIVEEMGVVKTLDRGLSGARARFLASTVLDDLEIGSSIGVNGVCLTVSEREDQGFSVDISSETLTVTNLGLLAPGVPVNLERPMKLHERIGGHLVSGHVDAVGTVRSRRQEGNSTVLTIEAPREVLRYCIYKGSLTVDGTSLTINELGERSVGVAIIPHTAKVTTLGLKKPDDPVNLESDMIGKYVERLLQERGQVSQPAPPVIDRDYLQKRGLM